VVELSQHAKDRIAEVERIQQHLAEHPESRPRRRAAKEPDWDFHCTDLAVAHVKAATGRDIWDELGGAPRSARQAADIFRRLKVRTLKSAVVKMLGKPIPLPRVMRGDIVMVDNALGICRGEWIQCVETMLPIDRAECAWKLLRG
jgi:hypothetical protein